MTLISNAESKTKAKLLNGSAETTDEINNNSKISTENSEHFEPFDDLLRDDQYCKDHLKPDLKGREHLGPVVKRYVAFLILTHFSAVYGLWGALSGAARWQTLLAAYLLANYSVLGNLAGAHRLWSHRSYKAKLPLRIFLMIGQTMGFMLSIWTWTRNHRQHHKYTDTDADPHNADRGFFYSHIGWILYPKHPECKAKHRTIDVRDVMADPVARFQFRHYLKLVALIGFVLPTALPVLLWGESWLYAFALCVGFRFCLSTHNICLINSAAHLYGTKPYNRKLMPSENLFVSYLSLGEGYHNYHHYFPMDYSASELSWRETINVSSFFIEAMQWLGQAYDLKKPSPESVKSVVNRLGDQEVYEAYIKTTKGSFGLWQASVCLLYFAMPLLVVLALRQLVITLIPLFTTVFY